MPVFWIVRIAVLPPRAGPLDEDVDLADPVLHRPAGDGLGRGAPRTVCSCGIP